MKRTERDRAVAEPNTILRGVVGSTAHGLEVPGTDDRDEMGVCVEPPAYVIGNSRFEQWIYRTAEEREGHDPDRDQRRHSPTPRSRAGDLDLTVYSLRKWCALAAKGNPSILLLMFLPEYRVCEPEAGRLIVPSTAEMFATRRAGEHFLNYLRAQRERLQGTRGQMRVTRTELIEQYGYDTKFASHAMRLGFQGVEYLRTGRITLPMPMTELTACQAVRVGKLSMSEALEGIYHLEDDLEGELRRTSLPPEPDYDRINDLLIQTYTRWWER